jgi:quinol monooxygenase YgiN
VFFERWADRDLLLDHFRAPASREFAKRVAQLAAHPPELATYEASELTLR